MDESIKKQLEVIDKLFARPKKDHILLISVSGIDKCNGISGCAHEHELDAQPIVNKEMADAGYLYCFRHIDEVRIIGVMIHRIASQAYKDKTRGQGIIEGEA